MSSGDVIDKLHDEHSLADSGSSEQPDFASFHVRSEQIDDLDTCGQQLSSSSQILEGRRFSVNGQFHFSIDGASFVDGLADHVHNSSQTFGTDWHHDGSASVRDFLASDQAVGGVKRDCSDGVSSQMLGDFEDESVVHSLHFESVQNRRQSFVELNVDNGSDNLRHFSYS